jgi:flagellar biosynthesis/type III secretory pathway protein FliH
LQREFKEELRRYQEESKMPLLSRIELEAKQEGIAEGRQQGLQESRQTLRETVIEVLEMRFVEVAPEVSEVLNGIEDVSVLRRLLKQAIAIPSIEDFQQVLQQIPANEEKTEPSD